MKKLLMSISCLVLMLSFTGCVESTDKDVNTITKDGSVGLELETKVENGKVILTKNQTVYHDGRVFSSTTYVDTIPMLSDTIQDFENEDSTWKAKVPKDYKFFVTIK